ncbi:hypothetical protein AVEN_152523-1 [Araneus ventricosus]|uniref:Caprin-1 dimerization domain-containing protein n=1 Tax=Araneus ventricosus TaxID=182803 RepID=A0A4Y2R956_ARAVE|nr:hypothetical protein AVEN_205727-1 [Araneus ventricosus]GBN72239.1 hypothetical protein AVEN_58012-1 [Araneus ventricosus]GBN72243.1 hypothetical protein AVEN_110536-1 [Araneus ventricosus]GBN72260.1 hypothetical protein AVEN_152523-1 [Araneus ventricosus]
MMQFEPREISTPPHPEKELKTEHTLLLTRRGIQNRIRNYRRILSLRKRKSISLDMLWLWKASIHKSQVSFMYTQREEEFQWYNPLYLSCFCFTSSSTRYPNSDKPHHKICFKEDFDVNSLQAAGSIIPNSCHLRVDDGTPLTPEQREKMSYLLEKFESIFKPGGDPTPNAEHHLNTEKRPPVSVPPYRMTPMKREQLERQQHEIKRLQEAFIYCHILSCFQNEDVRSDFLSGENGAVQLTSEQLSQLDQLYKWLGPGFPNERADISNHFHSLAENHIFLVEGKNKENAGTTYKLLKDLLFSIKESGYFSRPSEPLEDGISSDDMQEENLLEKMENTNISVEQPEFIQSPTNDQQYEVAEESNNTNSVTTYEVPEPPAPVRNVNGNEPHEISGPSVPVSQVSPIPNAIPRTVPPFLSSVQHDFDPSHPIPSQTFTNQSFAVVQNMIMPQDYVPVTMHHGPLPHNLAPIAVVPAPSQVTTTPAPIMPMHVTVTVPVQEGSATTVTELKQEITPYLKSFSKFMAETKEVAEMQQDLGKECGDRKRRRSPNYFPGDRVFVTTHHMSNAAKGRTTKFMPKRDGPYINLTEKSPTSYVIGNPEKPNEPVGTYHASALKVFKQDESATPVHPIRERGRPRKTFTSGSTPRRSGRRRNQRGSL